MTPVPVPPRKCRLSDKTSRIFVPGHFPWHNPAFLFPFKAITSDILPPCDSDVLGGAQHLVAASRRRFLAGRATRAEIPLAQICLTSPFATAWPRPKPTGDAPYVLTVESMLVTPETRPRLDVTAALREPAF